MAFIAGVGYFRAKRRNIDDAHAYSPLAACTVLLLVINKKTFFMHSYFFYIYNGYEVRETF